MLPETFIDYTCSHRILSEQPEYIVNIYFSAIYVYNIFNIHYNMYHYCAYIREGINKKLNFLGELCTLWGGGVRPPPAKKKAV